jgi:hypothetical protein
VVFGKDLLDDAGYRRIFGLLRYVSLPVGGEAIVVRVWANPPVARSLDRHGASVWCRQLPLSTVDA